MCDTTGYENISDWGASSWERKLYRSSNLLFPATTISILQCVYSYLQHIQIPCLKKKANPLSTAKNTSLSWKSIGSSFVISYTMFYS